MPEVLRTAFRGYNKAEVLERIDALNILLMKLEEGSISKDEALEMSESIVSVPMNTVFSGFNKEDADEYISGLREQIMYWTSR